VVVVVVVVGDGLGVVGVVFCWVVRLFGLVNGGVVVDLTENARFSKVSSQSFYCQFSLFITKLRKKSVTENRIQTKNTTN
jgi:hypothetical protein